MSRRFVLAFVLAALLSGALPLATSARLGEPSDVLNLPGRQVIVRAGHTLVTPKRILAPAHLRALNGEPLAATANIEVAYTGFSPEAQAAFDAAVAVWENLIVSPCVIHVTAGWTPLGTGVLGSAGPTSFYKLSGDDRWYPAALYETTHACSTAATEIDADFNSAFPDWYLGTDGNAPVNKYDFFSVVLHELGHGLGFISSFAVSGATGCWGLGSFCSSAYPLGFDLNEWDSYTGGNLLTNTAVYPKTSSALKTQLTDGTVYFGGDNVVAANGGNRAPLYAPNPWEPGSSNSHFDEDAFPAGNQNALMTPYLDNGEVNHDPGPLTLALFRDIGWSLAGGTTAPGQPTGVTASAGNAQALVSWVAPSSNGGSPITGYTATSSPDGLSCATASLSCAVTGLANGTPYTFTVTATNAVGTGSPSNPSNSVTPQAPAGPANDNFATAQVISGLSGTVAGSNVDATGESGEPLNTTLSSPIESIWYAWQAPATGAAAIDLCGSSFDTTLGVYTGAAVGALTLIFTDDDGGCGLTSRATFTAANGTTYFISVDGYGSSHGATNLTYSLTADTSVPGAPSGVTAVAGNAQATVSWSAPASNGGSPITSYTATSSPGSKICTTPNGITLSCTVAGLTNGVAYTFSVVATNAVGPGSASPPSAAVTPTAPPSNFKPDGRVRLGTGAYVGNNIYNTTGLNQAKTGAKLRGATITFGVSIQNDGPTTASFKLTVSGTASAMYSVTYWHGTTNITAAVVAGTFATPSLAPGAKYLVTVKVKVNSSATKGSSTTRLVTISSVGDPTKQDAVSFTGKRK